MGQDINQGAALAADLSAPAVRHSAAAVMPPPQAVIDHYVRKATADNTRLAYRSSITHFQAWGGHLPCQESLVLRYVAAHAGHLNPRTLALRLTALSQWHHVQGFPNPVRTPLVDKVMEGVRREHGRPTRKAKALPVEDLVQLAEGLGQRMNLKAVRDNALLQIGFYGAFRRSELCAIEVEWLEWVPQGVRILLPRSKTDTSGQGIVKAIPYAKTGPCPVHALRRWLAEAGIESGPVFRKVSRWGTVGKAALVPASLNAILYEHACAAQLPYAEGLSSHSLRRGLATSAYRAGADFKAIKRQGGWRTAATVQGYIDEAGEFDVNAAGVLLGK